MKIAEEDKEIGVYVRNLAAAINSRDSAFLETNDAGRILNVCAIGLEKHWGRNCQ